MNPLLYIPGEPLRDVSTLFELGLQPYADQYISAFWSDVFADGPDGGRGLLVRFESHMRPETSSPQDYNVETQTWCEAAKSGDLERGRYWIGWDTANPPGPMDLLRTNTTAGQSVVLLDGNAWIIPALSKIPHALGLDLETGEEIRTPRVEFASFVAQCRQWQAYFMECGLSADALTVKWLQYPGGFRWAIEALAMNYRVTADLVSDLELFGDSSSLQVLLAALECG